MNLIRSLLQAIPLSSVLREELNTAEYKFEELAKKIGEMEARERESQARIASLQQENLQLKEALQQFAGAELDKTDIAILLAIGEYQELSSGDLEELLRLSHTNVEFHLHKLVANFYINPSQITEMHKAYMLQQKGRRFLAENTLD